MTTGHCKCGKAIDDRSKQCQKCAQSHKKYKWPSDKDLLKMLETKTQRQVAQELGVGLTSLRNKLLEIRR